MQKGTSWITVELRSPDYDREWVHIQAYPLNIRSIRERQKERCLESRRLPYRFYESSGVRYTRNLTWRPCDMYTPDIINFLVVCCITFLILTWWSQRQ